MSNEELKRKALCARLKRINYEGCQQFYNGVNKLNLLETLRPNEWLDRLQPPIKNAERDFVKEGKRFQYLPLETVLRERPELVWKFYDSLFTHDVLSKKENLLRMVTDVVRNLPDSQFYEIAKWNSRDVLTKIMKVRNLAINKKRIKNLSKWALQDMKSVITHEEAIRIYEKKDSLSAVLSDKIDKCDTPDELNKLWKNLINFIKNDLKMTDLARCLQTPPPETRTASEIANICAMMPDLPENFVRRQKYCDDLERLVDGWDNSGRIVLHGDKDTGLTTLAIFAAEYAVRQCKVDHVVWMDNVDKHHCAIKRFDIRTLVVMDSPCSVRALNAGRFVMVILNEKRSDNDFKVVHVEEAFKEEDFRCLLWNSFPSKSGNEALDDLAGRIFHTISSIPLRLSAICEAISLLKDKVQHRNGDDDMEQLFNNFDSETLLQKLDQQNKEPAYWKDLDERLKECYHKLILFCDTEASICVHSMAPMWGERGLDYERRTRERLSIFERKLLLVKRNVHEGCQTYRLTSHKKEFLQRTVNAQKISEMKKELLAKYECIDPDVRDEFYYSQIVALLLETNQLKKAIKFLTNFRFKEQRVKSGTIGNLLHDFQLVTRKGGCGKDLHLHYAMAEMDVPAILASNDSKILNSCARLRLIKAPCPSGPPWSMRLHKRHRFENRPFLPKLKSGMLLRRTPEGDVEGFPMEEFFTHIDCSPDKKFIVLSCNLEHIYLVDACSIQVLDRKSVTTHVFFVHFLNDKDFVAVANNGFLYFTIEDERRIEIDTRKLSIDFNLISNLICYGDVMAMSTFKFPVTLHQNVLWVSKDDGVYTYSFEENGAEFLNRLPCENEDSTFLAVCNQEEVQIAANCCKRKLQLVRYNEVSKAMKLVRCLEKDCTVGAAAWIGSCLVYSMNGAEPTLTLCSLNVDHSELSEIKTVKINFSPNFALSERNFKQVLFGKVDGPVALVGDNLTLKMLPLRHPHVMTLTSGEDGSTNILGAFECQHIKLFEWPNSKESSLAPVPVAVPIALTENFTRLFYRHEPNVVLKVCTVGKDDVAIVVHKLRVCFVRLQNIHVIFQSLWPNNEDDLRTALCEVDATDRHFRVVIATKRLCIRYHVYEKRLENLGNTKNDLSFESLAFRGDKLLCFVSSAQGVISLYSYENNKWKDITSNQVMIASQLILMKDIDDADLLLMAPKKGVTECCYSLFNFQEKSLYPFNVESAMFDVSSQAKRLAIVHQQHIIVYELRQTDTRLVKDMQFDGEASIYTVSFLPNSENLLSVVFAASAFSDLKLSVWDIEGGGGTDIFEIDIQNAITSFNFIQIQQLNSKIFWSLKTGTAFFLTETSLTEIDLKTLTTNQILYSYWLFGSDTKCFDVHKSFVSDDNVCLVLNSAEMFWFQRG